MKKNVLLLCLSTVKVGKKVKKTVYSFDKGGETDLTVGYLTNEAPVKSLITKLDVRGERLDDIILICSQSVRDSVLNDNNYNEQSDDYKSLRSHIPEQDRDRFEELSAVELYKGLVQQYSRSLESDIYREKPIAFHEIQITNMPDGPEVANVATLAANYVAVDGDGANLYIDYNGGQRYVAFMMVGIANLMKVRGVEVKEVMTMNYELQKDGIVPIENMQGVFECVDLVAGINEYINYGRSRMLETYFQGTDNEEIKSILQKMSEFSHQMQLCNIEYILEKKDGLKEELEDYKKNAEKRADSDGYSSENTYEVLFSYVVTDILEGYRILFEGEELEIIEWCLKKDYVQQALTFYAECMPAYFWKKGFFQPSEAEQKEYDAFWIYCENNPDSKIGQFFIKEYKTFGKEYCWMTKYLRFSHEMRARHGYIGGALSNMKANFETAKGQGRAQSILTRGEWKRVVREFNKAKKRRNALNHADKNNRNDPDLQYGNIYHDTLNAVSYLRELISKYENQ